MPAALELRALQREIEAALLQSAHRVALGLPAAAVPDDHLAAAVLALRDLALEVGVVERMVLDVHREPLVAGHQARPAGDGPARQRVADLEAEVVVQPPRRVLLHHEGVAVAAAVGPGRLVGGAEVALAPGRSRAPRQPALRREAARVAPALLRPGLGGGALAQRFHQVDRFGGLRRLRLGDGLAFGLGLDQRGERVVVAVLEALGLELAALGVDDVAGEIEHLLVELQLRDVVEDLGRVADLVVELEGVGDEAGALRADEHRAQAAEEHGAGDRRGLALGEPGADHREGGPGRLAVRGQIVGAVEVERVDLAAGDEGLDAQRLVALRHRLGQLLFLDHDRFAAVGLVALCLVVALDRLAGLGIDEHAADAVAGLAVDDVEGDALGGRGGGVQSDRADELPDLEVAFPDRARCHDPTCRCPVSGVRCRFRLRDWDELRLSRPGATRP